jgi:hypothetical protein
MPTRSRQQLIYLAKIAEQAERYEGMYPIIGVSKRAL